YIQPLGVLLDRVDRFAIVLDEGCMFGSTADGFECERARTGIQIEHVRVMKVEKIREHIEQRLASAVGRGACRHAGWGEQLAASITACNDSHGAKMKDEV